MDWIEGIVYGVRVEYRIHSAHKVKKNENDVSAREQVEEISVAWGDLEYVRSGRLIQRAEACLRTL